MALSNPAFSPRNFSQAAVLAKAATQQPGMSAEQLDELYSRPAATPAETDRMSYEDTIFKTVVTLVLVLAGGAVGYLLLPQLMIPALLVGTVLAFVNIFKKQPSAALVLLYAVAQGVAIGGLSYLIQVGLNQPGIVGQALLGTGLVFGVTLVLFLNGKVRASRKATKVFLIAMIAYALFSLVNLGLMLFGVSTDPWGLRSAEIFGIPLGLILAPLVILMAAYSLVLDFTMIKQGVEQGAPRNFAWKAAFGLVLTIVWLYIEILRMISIFRSN